jgi:acetyl/propionyl-CoA carboxylase alpha subunit
MALHPQAIAREIAQLEAPAAAARMASLQRRQATLERICADALRLGTAVHLRGAATVEFLIDQQGEPYFLEVNPRIQVEHGVTEGIARVRGHAISLVELQQRIAAGEKLPFQQEDITFVGDAIEVRLNAWHEDLSPVLGGVLHTLRLTPAAALAPDVRLDAGGLLQRRQPWIVPSYDANFALLIVTGSKRHETLTRLIALLEGGLEIRGNAELQTNVQPVLGLLTLMRALPPETEFRTDTSLLWMALAALVATQKHVVLSQAPDFPRRPGAHDPALLARLLRATLEAGFAHPSRLLTYYLKRLTSPAPRPVALLEVLWQLAAELGVPLYAEERAQGAALQQAMAALWQHLSADHQQLHAMVRAAAVQSLDMSPEYQAVCAHLVATTPGLDTTEAATLLRYLFDWLRVEIPALTALVQALEQTHLHAFLAANDDLSLTRPAYLDHTTRVADLQRLLSSSLRPTLLRHGELLSPMEATIYHQPEPDTPPFVEIGAEIKVGQTLALLEAMKMFSELPSPVDGVLVDILVESGQGVKTGTPLFRIATQDAMHRMADAVLQQDVEPVFHNRFGLL